MVYFNVGRYSMFFVLDKKQKMDGKGRRSEGLKLVCVCVCLNGLLLAGWRQEESGERGEGGRGE